MAVPLEIIANATQTSSKYGSTSWSLHILSMWTVSIQIKQCNAIYQHLFENVLGIRFGPHKMKIGPYVK